MAFYVYKKEKPLYTPLLEANGTISRRKRDPIWTYFKKRKREQLVLAGTLAIIGFILLLSQLIPYGYSKVEEYIIASGLTQVKSPVPETYASEKAELAYYDISKSYFQNLVENIQGSMSESFRLYSSSGSYSDLVIDEKYNKPMKLTIESIGMNNLTITPNVDSHDEKIYNEALKKGAAHFKGTVLPGDNDFGNFVVYGHSALPSFFERNPNYSETAFTKLHKIRVGDKIQVVKDDVTYEYVVTSSKIVQPEEFDILASYPKDSIMTLITCFPAGDPSGRWVTFASQVK